MTHRFAKLATLLIAGTLVISACGGEVTPEPVPTVTETVTPGPTPEPDPTVAETVTAEPAPEPSVIGGTDHLWVEAGRSVVEGLNSALDPWEKSGCAKQDVLDGDEGCLKTASIFKLAFVIAQVKWETYASVDGEEYIDEVNQEFEERSRFVTEGLDWALAAAAAIPEVCPQDALCTPALDAAIDTAFELREGISSW